MRQLVAELIDLVPITKQILLERQYFEAFEKFAEMPHRAQVAYPALCQRNALYFVEIVDFGPNLIKAYKLNDNLLALLYSLQIGLCVVLYLMHLLSSVLQPPLLFALGFQL